MQRVQVPKSLVSFYLSSLLLSHISFGLIQKEKESIVQQQVENPSSTKKKVSREQSIFMVEKIGDWC